MPTKWNTRSRTFQWVRSGSIDEYEKLWSRAVRTICQSKIRTIQIHRGDLKLTEAAYFASINAWISRETFAEWGFRQKDPFPQRLMEAIHSDVSYLKEAWTSGKDEDGRSGEDHGTKRSRHPSLALSATNNSKGDPNVVDLLAADSVVDLCDIDTLAPVPSIRLPADWPQDAVDQGAKVDQPNVSSSWAAASEEETQEMSAHGLRSDADFLSQLNEAAAQSNTELKVGMGGELPDFDDIDWSE